MDELSARIAGGELILLDGATGTELERRGVPMDAAAWSAAALLTHPQTVRAVHADYLHAGADVIITNSFATARHQLEPAGLGRRFSELNTRAVELAREARDEVGRPAAVAASISSVHFERQQMRPIEEEEAGFREQAEILAEAGADLLMLEMMWDIEYSTAAVRAAVATGLPVWIGFCCRLVPPKGGRRNDDGSVIMFSDKYQGTLESVLEPMLPLGGSVAHVMHTETAEVLPALAILRDSWPGPVGVYAHSGRFRMPHWQFDGVISPEGYLAEARRWVEAGAQLIGGCCGIGPDHIRLLKQELPAAISRSPPDTSAPSSRRAAGRPRTA